MSVSALRFRPRHPCWWAHPGPSRIVLLIFTYQTLSPPKPEPEDTRFVWEKTPFEDKKTPYVGAAPLFIPARVYGPVGQLAK